ncbi:MAG TPA: hypothetical protein VER11_14910 [Polyangiaceae bacterium]|nr:hypothetical protein [Polyangiaceae bacterium]
MLIEKERSWISHAGVTTALLMLVGLGCGRISTELPLDQEDGGASNGGAGTAGASGGAANGGGVAGDSTASAGAGEVGGRGDEAGSGGSPGAAGSAGDGGAAGSGELCDAESALCTGQSQCTDLRLGDRQGSTVLNCGACGNTCSLEHANGATCAAGTCAPSCQSGFADCNSAAGNDGCETATTTVENCGACRRACSAFGATGRSCSSGQCAPKCAPHFADCNQDQGVAPDDGCETYLDGLDRCGKDCTAKVACAATDVCNDGSCVAPSGVVVISVPLTDVSQAQRAADILAPSGINLAGLSLTVRVYAPGAKGGILSAYASDTSSGIGPSVSTNLASISQNWTDITIPVAVKGSFNPEQTKQINLEVRSESSTSTANPTVVYVDSVRSSNLAVSDTFDASKGNFVMSSLIKVDGSTLTWAATVP